KLGMTEATGTAGAAEIGSFYAFGVGYLGGVSVAAGDVNGDGRADVIAGTLAGHNEVRVFTAPGFLQSTVALLPPTPGTQGVRVAAGDLDNDGLAELFAGPAVGNSQGATSAVQVISGQTGQLLTSFVPYAGAAVPVSAASLDLDNDGRADVITSAVNGQMKLAHLKRFNFALVEAD